MRPSFVISALAISGSSLLALRSDAAQLNVPADYATIQAAIVAAADGDEVIVSPGTYFENIDFLGKTVTVRGVDPDDPSIVWDTVLAGDEVNVCVTFANNEGTGSVLAGLTIINGKYGVYCKGDWRAPCVIPRPTITKNTIMNCTKGGIGIENASATIVSNTIRNNGGTGVAVGQISPTFCPANQIVVDSNTIRENASGLRCSGDGGPVTVTKNLFQDNTIIAIDCSADQPKGLLTIADNEIIGNGGGIKVNWGDKSKSIVARNNLLANGSGITAEATVIDSNTIIDSGLGINTLSEATISANTIAGNTQGGITFWYSGTVIVGNAIADNTAGQDESPYLQDVGGGIFCRFAAYISENVITGNKAQYGGGVYSAATNLWLTNNVIAYNEASIHGGGLVLDDVVACGNLIAGNKAGGAGGGIHVQNWRVNSLTANTIVGNSAAQGPALFYQGQAARLTNCIIHDNGRQGQPQLHTEALHFRIRNSNIQGGQHAVEGEATWLSGNIDANPLFVDPGHWDGDTFILGDYRLLPGSPCIDAGTNDVDNPSTWVTEVLPATDLAGIPRVIDGNLDGTATVDIGAYEFLPGDVNYDGRVNILDLITIRASLNQDPTSSLAARKADANADGRVNIEDLIFVRNRLGKDR